VSYPRRKAKNNARRAPTTMLNWTAGVVITEQLTSATEMLQIGSGGHGGILGHV
jgi:hypothetical protein